MNFNDFELLIYGIFIGWITKIPFFLKYYREWQKEKIALRQLIEKYHEYRINNHID